MVNALVRRVLPHAPAFVKRQALVQLFGATAASFEAEMPRLAGLSYEECLLVYARFSTDQAGKWLAAGRDLPALQERLYGNAYELGRLPGRLLRVRTSDDVMVLGRFLYSILDVDFTGSEGGEIRIARCYFSTFYAPQVCQLMSAMDRGLLAGLAGGGELAFTERITEGRPCCRAHFSLEQTR